MLYSVYPIAGLLTTKEIYMTFFEKKKQAELDGMEVTSKTTAKEIEQFYKEKGDTVVSEVKTEEVKEVKEPEVKIVEVIKEVATPIEHDWEFTCIQAVRGPAPRGDDGKVLRGADGKELKGLLGYKSKYVCKKTGDVELRDQTEEENIKG